MSHSRVLFFYSLTTLTCQFPLLLEMLIGRWTLGLIIQQLSFTLISCFVLSFFLFLSWSLPPPPPPDVPLSPFMFLCLCISISFSQPLLFCLIFLPLCFSIQLPHSVILLLSLSLYASVSLLSLFCCPSLFISTSLSLCFVIPLRFFSQGVFFPRSSQVVSQISLLQIFRGHFCCCHGRSPLSHT